MCVGFVLLAFSFCDVVWVFFFFLLLLNALLLASPKSRLLESYERDHLERGRRVKRENPPKTVCSQRLYIFTVCRLDLQHIGRSWQSFPTHPPSILPPSTLYKASCAACIPSHARVPRPAPCFLLSLCFMVDHLAGISQVMSGPLGSLHRQGSLPSLVHTKPACTPVGDSMFGSGWGPSK